MGYFSLPNTTFSKASTTAASKAIPKFFTAKPGTIRVISIINPALITKVNIPSVKKFTGKVNRINIGFKIIDSTPQTTAKIPKVCQSAITIPGTILAVMKKPNALIISCINITHLYLKTPPCQIRKQDE